MTRREREREAPVASEQRPAGEGGGGQNVRETWAVARGGDNRGVCAAAALLHACS